MNFWSLDEKEVFFSMDYEGVRHGKSYVNFEFSKLARGIDVPPGQILTSKTVDELVPTRIVNSMKKYEKRGFEFYNSCTMRRHHHIECHTLSHLAH